MLPIIYMDLVDASDLPAFEKLYEENKNIAFHRANKILNNTALAEECVSDVFLAIAKNFQNINKLNSYDQRKYIVTCCRNRALNIIEKEKKHSEDIPYDDAILTNANYTDLKDIELRDIAQRLNPTDLDILYWVGIQGIDYKTIAESYGISYAAAKQRYWTAKNNLLKLLSEEGDK